MTSKKAFRISLVIIWLIVIFIFSSFEGEKSTKQSSEVIYTVVDTIAKDKSEEQKNEIVKNNTYIVRKIAHFTEYLILGILVYRALVLYNLKYILVICIGFCILCASLDEFHQSFVSDRSSRVFDVFIDSCGAFTSLLCCNYVIYRDKDNN